ncbi:MAG: serine hydrolase [Acidobacteria bacterium]|nr:serine hydrolase [Acidobacteriota bacterium]
MTRIPLVVSADFERGASFRIEDITSFPWTMAVGATGSEEYARQLGAVTGREARALGVHWIFAPVMDVNNNPDNPVIGIRSFGEDPRLVARLGTAFIRGAHEARVLSGEIPITGRMPVSIPDHARIGGGLEVPRLDMTVRAMPPEAMGLPKDAFRETERLLASFVESKAFTGAVLMVGYRGAVVLDAAVGTLDYAQNSARASGDTIYDLASVTKAVATTPAAMMLAESGRLILQAPVQDYLPEFQGPDKEKVLVRHFLTHSSGLPSHAKIYLEARSYHDILARVCATRLEYPPGSRAQYSDFGMILLGEIIQRAAGRPLDQFVKEGLLAPLGMNSTGYRPRRSLLPRIAPTENDPWRRWVVRGEVHDENAFVMGGVAGHAGLFSTAYDLAVFAQMMLNGGIYDHHRYFSRSTVTHFTSGEIGNRALGWGKPSDADWTAKTFSPEAYGHTGFTGTSIWIDPASQMFMILLTNRVHSSRTPDRMPEVRQAVSEAVVRALSPVIMTGSRGWRAYRFQEELDGPRHAAFSR